MTITEITTLETQLCCVCGVMFAMPKELLHACRKDPKKDFYCPNGHSLVFKQSILEQEIQKLKEEKDNAERARMSLHNELTEKQKEVAKLMASIKRRNKRTFAGVCPCCNRTVKELADHIKTKHPEMLPKSNVNPMHERITKKTTPKQ